MDYELPKGYQMDIESLPARYPTHEHDGKFWESLGRVVATFGFLEEILGKAIFSFTATKPYRAEEIEAAYEKWPRKLEEALIDPLGKLISDYEKAIREHPKTILKREEIDNLIFNLRESSKIRNVVCHGSWRVPNSEGASIPLFVDKKLNEFATPVDCAFLEQVQRSVAQLSCAVVNSVTCMGWQFPGSSGPGNVIMGD